MRTLHRVRPLKLLLVGMCACGQPDAAAPVHAPPSRSAVVPPPVASQPAVVAPEPSEGARLAMSNDNAESIRGAEWLAKNGTNADGNALVTAFDRALARRAKEDANATGRDSARAACMALRVATIEMARRGLSSTDCTLKECSPGETAVWIITSHAAPSRSAGWQAAYTRAVAHEHPFVATLALEAAPLPFPSWLIPATEGALARPEPEVHRYACLVAQNEKLTALAPRVLATLRTTRREEALATCFRAARDLGKRLESAEVLVARIGEPDMSRSAIFNLATLLARHNLASTAAEIPAERARLHAQRWAELLKKRRADIEAGTPIQLDATIPRDLVPPGWRVVQGKPGHPDWP